MNAAEVIRRCYAEAGPELRAALELSAAERGLHAFINRREPTGSQARKDKSMDMRPSLQRMKKARKADDDAEYTIVYSTRPPMLDAGIKRKTIVRGRRNAESAAADLRYDHFKVHEVRRRGWLFD